MNIEEALALFGVNYNVSSEEVTAVYRKLIRRAHPDKGGSTSETQVKLILIIY